MERALRRPASAPMSSEDSRGTSWDQCDNPVGHRSDQEGAILVVFGVFLVNCPVTLVVNFGSTQNMFLKMNQRY